MLGNGFPIWANILLLVIGLVIITKGADKFVDSAVAISEKTSVPRFIIGATIVSLGTTFPEFMVSIMAGFFNQPQTTMGDAIGSAICNIGLILGTCLLIKPVVTNRRLFWNQGTIMLFAGILIMLLSLDGYLSRWDSLILTAGLIGYAYFSVRLARIARENKKDSLISSEQTIGMIARSTYSLRKAVVWFVLGVIAVIGGATLVVQNAVIVARWLEVPELVIGLTVVAIGTSLPEYVTALTASIKGYGEIAVSNMIGADILDIFWVRGVGSLGFFLLPIERQTLILDYPAMLTIMVLLLIFGATSRKLARWQGGILLIIYGIYITIMFRYFT